MWDEQQAIDVITVQQRLKDRNLLEQVGGMPYLSDAAGCGAERGESEYYLEIVWEKYLLRRAIHGVRGVHHAGFTILRGTWTNCWIRVEADILKVNEARATAELRHDEGS
jgi:replicative DNA helicase